MHDMGYLSQVADTTKSIRDSDGVVTAGFQNYVQKIRTPALKGLRFNRFVTDSHRNTRRSDHGMPTVRRLRLPVARRAGLRCDRGRLPARWAGDQEVGGYNRAQWRKRAE